VFVKRFFPISDSFPWCHEWHNSKLLGCDAQYQLYYSSPRGGRLQSTHKLCHNIDFSLNGATCSDQTQTERYLLMTVIPVTDIQAGWGGIYTGLQDWTISLA